MQLEFVKCKDSEVKRKWKNGEWRPPNRSFWDSSLFSASRAKTVIKKLKEEFPTSTVLEMGSIINAWASSVRIGFRNDEDEAWFIWQIQHIDFS